MSDTLLLLIVVAANVAFASALAFMRLRAVGWPPARTWRMIAEIWAFFGFFVLLCWWGSARLGNRGPNGPAGGMEGFADRFAAMALPEQALLVGAAIAAAALFGHVLASVNKGMRQGPQ